MPLPAFLAAAVPALVNTVGNLIGSNVQQNQNMEMAKYQASQNMRMLRFQLRYDRPINQRKRMEEAGYNPNLFYGQGSPGNQGTPLRFPDVQTADWQGSLANIGTQIAQMKLMQSQTDLTNQKVNESGIKQDLMSAQRDLVKANPLMKEEYVNSLVTQLKATAQLKEQEAGFMLSKTHQDGIGWERGFLKMQRQLDLLEQELGLKGADSSIKAQILNSKKLENALRQIQVDWMKDGDITPQHIYQGIMMILSKMM